MTINITPEELEAYGQRVEKYYRGISVEVLKRLKQIAATYRFDDRSYTREAERAYKEITDNSGPCPKILDGLSNQEKDPGYPAPPAVGAPTTVEVTSEA